MIELFIMVLLAGSLEELQSEVTGTDTYRTELESYVTLHNITILLDSGGNPAQRGIDTPGLVYMPLTGNYLFTTEGLESIVREHMDKCQTVMDGDSVNIRKVVVDAVFSGTC